MANFHSEFSLESVRQYMLMKDGQVTNHELVKHFKHWLTHPTQSEVSRQKFKEYVNTLATIKQVNGEKFLVLKQKFYPRFDDDPPAPPPPPPVAARPPPPPSSEPSLLDEVMAGLSHTNPRPPPPPLSRPPPPQQQQVPPPPPPHQQQQRRVLPPLPDEVDRATPSRSQRSSYASLGPAPYHKSPPGGGGLPTYRPPPPAPPGYQHRGGPVSGDFGLPLPSEYGLPQPRQGVFHPPPHDPYHHPPNSMIGPGVPPGAPPVLHRRSPPEPLPPPPPLPAGPPPGMPQALGLPQQQHPPPSRRESVASSASISRSSSAMSINQQMLPPQLQARGPMGPGLPQQAPLPQSGQRTTSRSDMSSAGSSNSVNNVATVSRKNSSEDNKENARGEEPPTEASQPPRPSSSLSSTSSHHRHQRQSRDEKISVKERTKTFNRMCSEVDLAGLKPQSPQGATLNNNSSSHAAAVKRRNSRAENGGRSSKNVDDGDGSQDSSSISTLDTHVRQWMVRAAQADYHTMVKMLRDDSKLAKHRDFVTGYTALHWAAKHGNMDLVKLLAGNYGVPVNVKSHGGYTPLHMACQHGHQDIFEILVKAYGADPNIRDNSGKKPRQYMVVQDQSMGLSLSSDTFRQLKDRRSQRRRDGGKAHSTSGASGGMTRFGSLSVKVKKTTEAFNSYFNSKMTSDSSDQSQPSSLGPISLPMDFVHTSGMSSSSLTSTSTPIQQQHQLHTADTKLMPPPSAVPGSAVGLKKRKSSKRYTDYGRHQSAPVTPTGIKEESSEEVRRAGRNNPHQSDSDSEYGFDSQWAPPR